MAYTVSLSGSAEADAYAAFEHIREVAPASAARWLTGLFASIRTLADESMEILGVGLTACSGDSWRDTVQNIPMML